MYSNQDLDDAVDAGIIEKDTALKLRDFWCSRIDLQSTEDEHVRLISGFNDLFVVIACLMLVYGASQLLDGLVAGIGSFAEAAIAWCLSLYFVSKKRMAFPAIVLLVVYVMGLYQGVEQLLFGWQQQGATIAGLFAAAGAWLHWRVFKVPITIAAGAVAVFSGTAVTLLALFPESIMWLNVICFAAGVVLFLWALRWDFSDRLRNSGRSDVAFWLHLVASPMLVHPIFFATGALSNDLTAVHALGIVLLYVGLSIISLLIDRRALLVSALAYVVAALGALFAENGFVDQSTTITVAIVGLALIGLSAGWRTLRASLVTPLPKPWREKLPTVR